MFTLMAPLFGVDPDNRQNCWGGGGRMAGWYWLLWPSQGVFSRFRWGQP